jgi:hypothetical protein
MAKMYLKVKSELKEMAVRSEEKFRSVSKKLED